MQKNFSMSGKKKIRIAKALLCWQCQFDDLGLVKRVVDLIQEHFGHDEAGEILSTVGDFEISSKRANTLFYAINSGKLEILRLMIEKHGTRLIYKSSSGVIFNPFACAIRANHLNLLNFLLDKFNFEGNFFSIGSSLRGNTNKIREKRTKNDKIFF
jgi:hypothetical protein